MSAVFRTQRPRQISAYKHSPPRDYRVGFRQGATTPDSIIPRARFGHEHDDSDSTEPPKSPERGSL